MVLWPHLLWCDPSPSRVRLKLVKAARGSAVPRAALQPGEGLWVLRSSASLCAPLTDRLFSFFACWVICDAEKHQMCLWVLAVLLLFSVLFHCISSSNFLVFFRLVGCKLLFVFNCGLSWKSFCDIKINGSFVCLSCVHCFNRRQTDA